MPPPWGTTLKAQYIMVILHFGPELHGLQKGFRSHFRVFHVILGNRARMDIAVL